MPANMVSNMMYDYCDFLLTFHVNALTALVSNMTNGSSLNTASNMTNKQYNHCDIPCQEH